MKLPPQLRLALFLALAWSVAVGCAALAKRTDTARDALRALRTEVDRGLPPAALALRTTCALAGDELDAANARGQLTDAQADERTAALDRACAAAADAARALREATAALAKAVP